MEKTKYNRAAKDQSQLQQFVDEVCEQTPEKQSTPVIHTYAAGTTLTSEIFAKFKTGDILVIQGYAMKFLIGKMQDRIRGVNISSVSEGIASMDIVEWSVGSTLSYTTQNVGGSGENAPEVYDFNDDLDVMPKQLLKKLKVGDVVYSQTSAVIATVDDVQKNEGQEMPAEVYLNSISDNDAIVYQYDESTDEYEVHKKQIYPYIVSKESVSFSTHYDEEAEVYVLDIIFPTKCIPQYICITFSNRSMIRITSYIDSSGSWLIQSPSFDIGGSGSYEFSEETSLVSLSDSTAFEDPSVEAMVLLQYDCTGTFIEH